jgi:hypothetical protein
MKRKRLLFLLVGLLCVVLLGIFLMRGKDLSTGYCIAADNGSYLLVIDSSPIVMQAIGSENMFSGLQTGNKILVVHNGIATSYPGQTGAYLCLRLQKGDPSDVPENVLAELRELGWISSGSDETGNMPEDTETTTAAYAYQFANMSLELPEDWEYEVVDVDSAAEEGPVLQFGISFWPSAEPEALFRL